MSQQGTLKDRLHELVVEMVEKGILFEDACAEFERHFIGAGVERHNGNISKAAEEIRVHRNTLGRRVREYGGKPGRGRTRRDSRRVSGLGSRG